MIRIQDLKTFVRDAIRNMDREGVEQVVMSHDGLNVAIARDGDELLIRCQAPKGRPNVKTIK